MDNFLSLDLEMAQPSGKIIQIGACVGNLRTGEILDTYSKFVKIDEPLTEFIVALTGITDNCLSTEGVNLFEAYQGLLALSQRFTLAHCNPIVWGGGDSRVLKEQLIVGFPAGMAELRWPFGHRWLDIKTLFQLQQFKRGEKLQAGLAKALVKSGLKFAGRKHNALDDSINTFRLAHKLMANYG